MEASEARAILRRLGEEAYTSQMPILHRHVSHAEHPVSRRPPAVATFVPFLRFLKKVNR